MNFINVKTYDEMSRVAADIVIEQLKKKPDSVLGLATGSSPVGMYNLLVEANKNGEIDFSKVTTINLDEYFGLSGDNDQSYRYFMNDKLFNHVNINKANTYVPSGNSSDPEEECKAYDALIEKFGIDLQVLGVGRNGHIGFNEPDDVFSKGTHVTRLDESTIKANARFFENESDVPTMALTMGIESIMSAKKIILVANGDSKKPIIEKLRTCEVDPHIPVSILKNHPDATIIFSES